MSKIIDRKLIKDQAKHPLYELERVTIENDGKNPEVFYDHRQQKITLGPGEKATFLRPVPKSLGRKKLRLTPVAKYKVELE
jgi:hypothetical protein